MTPMPSGEPAKSPLLEKVESAIADEDPVRLRKLLEQGDLDVNEPLDPNGYRLLTYALEIESCAASIGSTMLRSRGPRR